MRELACIIQDSRSWRVRIMQIYDIIRLLIPTKFSKVVGDKITIGDHLEYIQPLPFCSSSALLGEILLLSDVNSLGKFCSLFAVIGEILTLRSIPINSDLTRPYLQLIATLMKSCVGWKEKSFFFYVLLKIMKFSVDEGIVMYYLGFQVVASQNHVDI